MTLEEAFRALSPFLCDHAAVGKPYATAAAKAAMLAVLEEARGYSSAHSKAYDRIKERI